MSAILNTYNKRTKKGLKIAELIHRAKVYVESQSKTDIEVLSITFAERFILFG